MPKRATYDEEWRQIQRRYKELQRNLKDLPWLLQGTVVERPPPTSSSTAKTAFRWTRKVRGRTVNVSLSKQQAIAIRRAIQANRQLEKTLQEMRELSQSAIIPSSPELERSTTQNHAKKTTK